MKKKHDSLKKADQKKKTAKIETKKKIDSTKKTNDDSKTKTDSDTKTKNVPKPKSINPEDFEEGNYSYFEQIVSNKSNKWKLEVKSIKYDVILWLDKIDEKTCLLTIFPISHISERYEFPISATISRFPQKGNKLPYKLSKFGLIDCDYNLHLYS